MNKNKLYMIYDNVIKIKNSGYIIIDKNAGVLLIKDGNIHKRYTDINEPIKGLYIFFNKNTCEIYDSKLSLLYECTRDNLRYYLANILDNMSYDEINKRLKNSYKSEINNVIYKLKRQSTIVVRIENSKCNIETLRIIDNSTSTYMDSIFVDGKRESDFTQYSDFGATVDVLDKRLRIVNDNETKREYNKLRISKLYNKKNYICICTGVSKIVSTDEFSIVLAIQPDNRQILKIWNDGYDTIVDSCEYCKRNKNSIIVYCNKNNIHLYNLDMTQKLNPKLAVEKERYYSTLYSYINDRNEKVYLFYKDTLRTLEIHRGTITSRLEFKSIRSSDKLISGMTIIRDNETKKIVGTLITLRNNLEEFTDRFFLDMNEFWGKTAKIENNFNLDIYIAHSVYTGLYYVVDKNGNLVDNMYYVDKDDIIKKYKNTIRLKNILV